jgi:hypothetical protein
MFYDNRYPDVSRADWEKFRTQFNRFTYVEVIDRYQAGLMDQFFPLARGVIVASPRLKERLVPCLVCVRHFVERNEGFWSHDTLKVREWVDAIPQRLWSVERWINGPCVDEFDEVLVHTFGGTPIFTTDRMTAMAMAIRCNQLAPLPGTRWMKFPNSINELRRQIDYASVRDDLALIRALSPKFSEQVH